MQSLEALQSLVKRFCSTPIHVTDIPRVWLVRSDTTTEPMHVVYEPVLCIVAQGCKRAFLNRQVIEYDASNYLVVSVDLPVTGVVSEASLDKPYLAFALTLDRNLLADMLLDMPPVADPGEPHRGYGVSPIDEDLLDPVVRLLRLLERPADIPILAPLIEREILYRLLTGPQSAMLRQIALSGSHLSQIGRAIDWIKRHYSEAFSVEHLARLSNMSESAFHRHFKSVTEMSPLQYQKRIRLQEARKRLLIDEADAASVGFAVGYGSPSQFSREYTRLFGAPPARDAERLRRSTADLVQAA